MATLSYRQNYIKEEPLGNSVALCNNPIPKDTKGLGTSFCLCQKVAKPLFEQTEVSPDTDNSVNLSSNENKTVFLD